MKKLTKLNIDALKREVPVLSTIEERIITGGTGQGDCLYYTIAFLTGNSIESVRQKYIMYLYQIEYSGDVGSLSCGGNNENNEDYMACVAMADKGVRSKDQEWLMAQYGFSMSDLPSDDCGSSAQVSGDYIFNYRYSIDEGHSVILKLVNSNGDYIFYDPQLGKHDVMMKNIDKDGNVYYTIYGKVVLEYDLYKLVKNK